MAQMATVAMLFLLACLQGVYAYPYYQTSEDPYGWFSKSGNAYPYYQTSKDPYWWFGTTDPVSSPATLYWWNRPTSRVTTGTPYWWNRQTTEDYYNMPTVSWSKSPGQTLHLSSTPVTVVTGVTSHLTLTCSAGNYEDVSKILLMQINHLKAGVKVPVADVTYSNSPRALDGSRHTTVRGYIPYSGHYGAYLQVTVDSPTVTDDGQWECTLSGLDRNQLSVRDTTTTTVTITNISVLASEVSQLRKDVHTAESDNRYLKTALSELQQRQGQGFTAFHMSNTSAIHGRLPFQKKAVDTLGGFSNSVLTPPTDGLYHLCVTVGVSRGHYVTVALSRGYSKTITTITAIGGSQHEGQSSACVVTSLSHYEAVSVEVVDFSAGAVILGSPFTFLSGHFI